MFRLTVLEILISLTFRMLIRLFTGTGKLTLLIIIAFMAAMETALLLKSPIVVMVRI